MKSSEIIAHILKDPLYKKVSLARECIQVLRLLGKSKSRLIKFTYIKENSLFIATAHPLALQELRNDSTINLIKSLLKKYGAYNEDSELQNIKNIVVFITKLTNFKTYESNPKPKIIEKSRGKFTNLAKDREIYELFENIRAKINARK